MGTPTVTGNVPILSYGAFSTADSYGGVPSPQNLSPVIVQAYYSRQQLAAAGAGTYEITDVAVFNRDLSVRSSFIGGGVGQGITVTAEIPCSASPNIAKDVVIEVLEYVNGTSGTNTRAVPGATVKLGSAVATTNARGQATFSPTGFTMGTTYPIEIVSPNHQDNKLNVSIQGGTGVADSNTSNDSYTVPYRSTHPYVLNPLSISLSISVGFNVPVVRETTSSTGTGVSSNPYRVA